MAAGAATSDGALRTLKGHTRWVTSVCTTPDCRHVISGSYDTTVRIWSLANGELLHALNGHTGQVTSVCTSTDGRRVMSGSLDMSVRVWALADGALVHAPARVARHRGFDAGRDGRRLPVGEARLIRVHIERGRVGHGSGMGRRRDASSHGAGYNGSASMWRDAAPGDMVKFSWEPGCANASSLARRYGGVLDADMSTTIRLLIPPDTYYMCYAFGPFPYDEEAEQVQRGLARDTRRLSESAGLLCTWTLTRYLLRASSTQPLGLRAAHRGHEGP